MKYSLYDLPPLSPPSGVEGLPDAPPRWYQFSLLPLRLRFSLRALVILITGCCILLGAYLAIRDMCVWIDRTVAVALSEQFRSFSKQLQRNVAHQAMEMLQTEGHGEELLKLCLSDICSSDATIRVRAALMLGEIEPCSEEAVDKLLNAVEQDPDAEVRAVAMESLNIVAKRAGSGFDHLCRIAADNDDSRSTVASQFVSDSR